MTTQTQALDPATSEKIDWWKSFPFLAVHAMCFAALWTGFHVRDVVVCLALYYARMILLTAMYHRYFAHRSFKTSRVFQFILAFLATTVTQKGILWWAAHHRHHHRASDQEDDVHSPVQKGFWFSHVGWIVCSKYDETRWENIRDFGQYPELRWLNRFHLVPPILLAVALYFIGGFELLVWGFFISTTLLWHGTFTINSLSHVFGFRRYKTTDTSRNNWLLALITCGEGWHNNHHYYQNTANQGWFWWEIDITWYVLKLLSWVGLVWDLRTPSPSVKNVYLKYSAEEREALQHPEQAIRAGKHTPAADALRAAGEKVREALTAAAASLPQGGPAPQALLKRR